VARAVGCGERVLLAARDATGAICGTVQLVPAPQENQPHRAEVSKLLGHRGARRGGAGALLMREVERAALALGRTLLTLDTATPEADRLYQRLGWTLAGPIPGYALNPDGSRCETRFYWKELGE